MYILVNLHDALVIFRNHTGKKSCVLRMYFHTHAMIISVDKKNHEKSVSTLLKGVTEVDELINMVSSKAGISADQARQAVNVVLGFLKDRLPAPIASQVDGVLSGQGAGGIADQAASALGDQSAGGAIDQAKGMLGGMFGQGD